MFGYFFTSTIRLIIDYFKLVDYFIGRLLVDYQLVDGSLSPLGGSFVVSVANAIYHGTDTFHIARSQMYEPSFIWLSGYREHN